VRKPLSRITPNSKDCSLALVTASAVKESVERLEFFGGAAPLTQQLMGRSSTQYDSIETDYDINGRVSP